MPQYLHLFLQDPYHHKNSSGLKSACPKDGQTALDNSVSISDLSCKRVGVSNNEIVVLNQTSERLYHGYVTSWSDLLSDGAKSQLIRNALLQNGLVSQTGKIIKQIIQ